VGGSKRDVGDHGEPEANGITRTLAVLERVDEDQDAASDQVD